MEKNIISILTSLFVVCAFISCGNTDYTKEEKLLKKVYLKDSYDETDTTKIITIVKAEKIRLYNPKLDENKQRMILFGKTSFKKFVDALDAYESGKISEDVVFKDMKEIFTSVEPNSDGLIVMLKMKNSDGYLFDILFSNNDVYYATFITDVGKYLSDQVYNYEINEARERFKEGLIDALQR